MLKKVTENTFYENLLLGFENLLKTLPFVSNVNVAKHQPVNFNVIQQWQFLNRIILPEDLTNFYLSTNGFSLTYRINYCVKSKNVENTSYLGKIKINSLENLNVVVNYDIHPDAAYKLRTSAPNIVMFTIEKINNYSEVVMVYFQPNSKPNFWLYVQTKNFFYLSDNFTQYLRMCLAHLAIPEWQLSILPNGLPGITREIFQILAPGIFERHHHFPVELNEIDLKVFDEQINKDDNAKNDSCKKDDKPKKSPVKKKSKKAA